MKTALTPAKIPGFARLAGAYTISEIGNWVGQVALTVAVFDSTNSVLATMGLFLAMEFAPGLIGSLLVARGESLGTRRTLPLLYVIEAVIFSALAFEVAEPTLAIVLALAAADGVFGLIGRTFTRTVVSSLLKPSGLLREGNAMINFGVTGAYAVGPAIAGAVIVATSIQTALFIDSASFLIAAGLVVAGSRLPDVRPEPELWWQRAKDGIGYVLKHPLLRPLLSLQALVVAFAAAVAPVEIVLVKDVLDSGDLGYGLLLGFWGGGMVLGSIAFAALRNVSLAALIGGGTLALAVGFLGLAMAPTIEVALAAAAIAGLGNGVQWVAVLSALQEAASDEFQARSLALLESINTALPGAGFVIGGLVAEFVSPRVAFLVAALGVAAALVFVARLRRMGDDAPLPAGPERD